MVWKHEFKDKEKYNPHEEESVKKLKKDIESAKWKGDLEEFDTKATIRGYEKASKNHREKQGIEDELRKELERETERHEGAKIHREAYEERHVKRDHNTQYGHG